MSARTILLLPGVVGSGNTGPKGNNQLTTSEPVALGRCDCI